MDYEEMLTKIQKASKDDVKKVIFEVNQDSIRRIDRLDITEDVKKELIKIMQNRTYLDMLLANALK